MKSILEEAQEITSGTRREQYGEYKTEAIKEARMFNELTGHNILPEEIPLLMIVVKLCREQNAHKRDNLVDIPGYCRLRSQMLGDEDESLGE